MTAPARLQAGNFIGRLVDLIKEEMDLHAKTNPYLNWIAETMKGVKNAIKKFHSLQDVNKQSKQLILRTYQLLAVDNAPCFARVFVGKVSPMRIQTPGAHVVAYPKINMQALTIMTGIKYDVNKSKDGSKIEQD